MLDRFPNGASMPWRNRGVDVVEPQAVDMPLSMSQVGGMLQLRLLTCCRRGLIQGVSGLRKSLHERRHVPLLVCQAPPSRALAARDVHTRSTVSEGQVCRNGSVKPCRYSLQVVMDMLDTLVPGGKAAECFEARHDYRDAFLPCFHRRVPHYRPADCASPTLIRLQHNYGCFDREHAESDLLSRSSRWIFTCSFSACRHAARPEP